MASACAQALQHLLAVWQLETCGACVCVCGADIYCTLCFIVASLCNCIGLHGKWVGFGSKRDEIQGNVSRSKHH